MKKSEVDNLVRYISRWGGSTCKDCELAPDGVCIHSGLPCDCDQSDKAIRHVLDAVSYGLKHGYISPSGEVK